MKTTKRKQYKIASKENIRLKKELDNIKNNNQASYIKYLEEENKKMIEWVQKIISMEKTFEIENIHPVQIPIYRNVRSYLGPNGVPIAEEEVVIPEIRYSVSRFIEC